MARKKATTIPTQLVTIEYFHKRGVQLSLMKKLATPRWDRYKTARAILVLYKAGVKSLEDYQRVVKANPHFKYFTSIKGCGEQTNDFIIRRLG